MKNMKILTGFLMVIALLTSCEKFIDLKPESNLSVEAYYSNYEEINTALMGCIGGLRAPLSTEWMLTEVRSDNAKQASTGSSSTPNIELNDLDMYTVSPEHPQVYNYWSSVYKNILDVNLVLSALGVKYDPSTGLNQMIDIPIMLDATKREKLIGEALFIRAYHYFNLVRLFGGVFMLTEPLTPIGAKAVNRSSAADIYNLILADLQLSSTLLESKVYDKTSVELGLPTVWASKALLAKVYLTLGRKAEAINALTGIIISSSHTLLANYNDVFSISNEMNAEIIFAVRYKAGGLGMGCPFGNLFAASNSGTAIINGDGSGYNYPTSNYNASLTSTDTRRATTISIFGSKLYVTKFLSPVTTRDDGENDFPVLRYADVLLMMAEAQGYPSGISYINQTRARAGLTALPATVNSQELFEVELLKERRLEFAYENQRFFDLVRLNALESTIKSYYAFEYSSHYVKYKPVQTLEYYQSRITEDKKLLPIPQREIDTNNDLVIAQNPGY